MMCFKTPQEKQQNKKAVSCECFRQMEKYRKAKVHLESFLNPTIALQISLMFWLRSFFSVNVLSGGKYENTNRYTDNLEKLSQMFFNPFETPWGQHSFYLTMKTSLYLTSKSLDSMWFLFSALTSKVALQALHNKLDLPESSALLFASLVSPPVSGMDELIADTSMSYACLVDAKIQLTL